MEEVLGNAPAGILLLNFILMAMGVILSPLLWGIFKRLGDVASSLKSNVEVQNQIASHLISVLNELHDARVRDKDLEGRLKGLNEKLDHYIQMGGS